MESDLAGDSVTPATRELRRSGGSCVLTIPPAARRLVGFEEGDELDISVDTNNQRLIIERTEG